MIYGYPHYTIITERERELLLLRCIGYSNKEIAHRLGVGTDTIRHKMTALFAKLRVPGRRPLTVAFLMAVALGVIKIADLRVRDRATLTEW